MTKKNYISVIVKGLKCTKAKKEDIKKQLTSDIEGALEGGETMEEIIKRMGKPQNVIKEFNDNFPEEEIKAAKKHKRIVIGSVSAAVLLFLILFMAWWWPRTSEIGTSEIFQEEDIKKQTEVVVELLDSKDYDGLKAMSDKAMGDLFSEKNIQEWDNIRTSLSENWGNLVSYGQYYMVEIKQMGKHYATVQVNVSYENISVTYTLSFDEEMRLAGLYMK